MIFKQFYLNCLAHASYLIGDGETRITAVVDPQRDIERYLEFAAEHNLLIKHVILTHLHADFIAGHLELRDRAGAAIYLGAKAQAEYRFTPLADGSAIEFGRVRLKALETPGHRMQADRDQGHIMLGEHRRHRGDRDQYNRQARLIIAPVRQAQLGRLQPRLPDL